VEGVTTSPKIPFHDNVWSSLKSKHTYLDSVEIEEMMTHVYGGLTPAEASRDNYAAFDRSRFEELMAMDQVTAEKFVGVNLFDDEADEDSEAEENDA
jgi:hypothetical protein